jgi:hypothetical protein
MLHTPIAKNLRPEDGPIEGPPMLPFGFRVSRTRHGVSTLSPPHWAETTTGIDEDETHPPAVTTTATVVVPAAETLNAIEAVPCPEAIVPFVTDQT